jgi:hypothetical protein
LMRSGFLSNLLSLRRRSSTYLASDIDKEVSEHDDMLAGGKLDHYLSVGQSAIDVVAKFDTATIDPKADFSGPSPEHFDLIFVGSLVTHVGLNQYTRAIRWFVDALEPGGPTSYGTSRSAPSWVARLIEDDPNVRILSLAGGNWANDQDVVVLQKRPIAAG